MKKTLFSLNWPVTTLVVVSVVLAPFMFTRVLKTRTFGLLVALIVLRIVSRIVPGVKLNCIVNLRGLVTFGRVLYGKGSVSPPYVSLICVGQLPTSFNLLIGTRGKHLAPSVT